MKPWGPGVSGEYLDSALDFWIGIGDLDWEPAFWTRSRISGLGSGVWTGIRSLDWDLALGLGFGVPGLTVGCLG